MLAQVRELQEHQEVAHESGEHQDSEHAGEARIALLTETLRSVRADRDKLAEGAVSLKKKKAIDQQVHRQTQEELDAAQAEIRVERKARRLRRGAAVAGVRASQGARRR